MQRWTVLGGFLVVASNFALPGTVVGQQALGQGWAAEGSAARPACRCGGRCYVVLCGIALLKCWICTDSGNGSGVLRCKRRCVKERLHVEWYWTCWLSCSGQGRSALWRPLCTDTREPRVPN